ncbi:MAG: CpsD/CapB family tyrosine-protein kinase [Terracidiphilus sp.]
MSRLYEALQRADLERKTTPEPDVDQLVDPEVISEIEQPPPAKADIVLDDIARYAWKPSTESFPTLADRGAGVEQFRSLRSRIYQARYELPLKTILVSSGMPSEGKSFITANLAMNLARNSVNNILLIDADLRRPSLHKLLGAPNVPGLYEYLGGTVEVKDILQRDRAPKPADPLNVGSISNLTFIPSGDCGDNSSELVANHRIEELIATVSPHFDWILIDSPPVLAVTDAVELAHAADAVLLIARGGRTPYDVAQRTQAAFGSSRILGFVLNDVKEMPRGGYNYYDYYGASAAANRAK